VANEHLGRIDFETQGGLTLGHFRAMANPCVIIIEHENKIAVQQEMRLMAEEVWRIEQKYSRYLATSALSQINNAGGKSIFIDHETYHLLQLADVLWQESQGKFDISSGVFRKIWTFNQQQQMPTQSQINDSLSHVGWRKIQYTENSITLPADMQIDFGGIGKEYAVDKCISLIPQSLGNTILVNLGGDVAAKGPRGNGKPWQIGIEHKSGKGKVWKKIPLSGGAIATSGDVYKSVTIDGIRYGHIINALTGIPVIDAPSTVTVAAPNCTEAGMLSTLALLQGKEGKHFLEAQDRPHWVQY